MVTGFSFISRQFKIKLLQTLLEVLLHMCDIIRMEEIVATFVQQIYWLVAKYTDYPLVHKRELPAHGMPRDEFIRIVSV